MNEKRRTEIRELLQLSKEIVSDAEYAEIREKYRKEEFDPKFTETRHRLITGSAVQLAEEVINGGGTKEDIKKAIINLKVCMDSMKHRLDWARWKRENDICLLIRKYETDKGVKV